MPESWSRLRTSALDSVETLVALLADTECDDRRLVAGYLETKQSLALAFEALSVERFSDDSVLAGVKSSIVDAMRDRYPWAPEKYRRVRNFGEAHSRLLAYLVNRAGTGVSALELRMLTRDAVHTERRARELRDLGFQLEARHASGSDVYVLVDAHPDLELGAQTLIIKNIREDRTIAREDAEALIRRVEEA